MIDALGYKSWLEPLDAYNFLVQKYTFYLYLSWNNYGRAFYSTNFEKQKAKRQKQGQTSFLYYGKAATSEKAA